MEQPMESGESGSVLYGGERLLHAVRRLPGRTQRAVRAVFRLGDEAEAPDTERLERLMLAIENLVTPNRVVDVVNVEPPASLDGNRWAGEPGYDTADD